jgi:hypothetical protein
MRFALPVVAFFLLSVVTAGPARGEIYRWVDEHGVVHLDDTLANIPDAARQDAKVFQARSAPAAPSTNGPVQSAFANGVARDLGLIASDTQDAVSVLHLVGIYPSAGWNPTAALTPAVVDEVTRTARAAARSRRLPQGEASAEASVLRVASSLGVAGPPPTALPEPPPPAAPEPPTFVVAPNITIESPPATVVVHEPAPEQYLTRFGFDPAFGGGVPFTPIFNTNARQAPIPDRIPPLSNPIGQLHGPLVPPRPGIQPFRRPPEF